MKVYKVHKVERRLAAWLNKTKDVEIRDYLRLSEKKFLASCK